MTKRYAWKTLRPKLDASKNAKLVEIISAKKLRYTLAPRNWVHCTKRT